MTLVAVDPYTPDTPSDKMTLEELASAINEAHASAENRMRVSLDFARLAGVRLLEVKRRRPHGTFMIWVKENCQFSHSTGLLYMKVARAWSILQESQRVENISLRDAAQLLGHGSDEETEVEADDLLSLDLLTPDDLRELSPAEVRTLVREVRAAYFDLVHDVDEVTLAERIARGAPEPKYVIDRRALASLAHETATGLRSHKISRSDVRGRLRPLDSWKTDKAKESSSRGGLPAARILYRTPFELYMEQAQRLAVSSRALLAAPHSLTERYVELSPEERRQLLSRLKEVREAVRTLEEQARARAAS